MTATTAIAATSRMPPMIHGVADEASSLSAGTVSVGTDSAGAG